MSAYDQIEKIFTGSWKYDRDENVDAFMAAMGKTKLFIIQNCSLSNYRSSFRHSNLNITKYLYTLVLVTRSNLWDQFPF